MYIPPAFAETRPDVLHAFIRAHDFATITTAGPGGMMASHVPVVLRSAGDGTFGVLQFHLAKQNPHAEALAAGEPVLAVFQGPHGYISPRWYTTQVAVPTWNYVAVHVHGTPRRLTPDELGPHLDELVSGYEFRADGWDAGRLPDAVGQKLREKIAGFEVAITRIEGKWKLSQNRTREDRLGAIAGLRALGDPATDLLADAMTAALERRDQ